MMKEKLIVAQKLTKTFSLPAGDVVAVNAIDLEVAAGEFVALMGPSGSGKTTLLDVVGCLDSITSGRLVVFGKDVSHARERDLVAMRRQGLGFVFQEFLLIPTLTALENVELPLVFSRQTGDRDRAQRLLEKVGLGHRTNHLPNALSGGERQRVAIARSLVTEPRLLLADEPTGNLDSRNSEEIFSVFEGLNCDENLTIVVTTHDEKLGRRAGRAIHLQDGRII